MSNTASEAHATSVGATTADMRAPDTATTAWRQWGAFARQAVWPLVILASTAAINVFVFGDIQSPARLLIAIWFVCVCPGMALVQLLRLSDNWSRMALGVAVSMALGVVVTTSLLYAGMWSHQVGLIILSSICVVASMADLSLAWRSTRTRSPQQLEGVAPGVG
jgi:uncharacterized membrane protein